MQHSNLGIAEEKIDRIQNLDLALQVSPVVGLRACFTVEDTFWFKVMMHIGFCSYKLLPPRCTLWDFFTHIKANASNGPRKIAIPVRTCKMYTLVQALAVECLILGETVQARPHCDIVAQKSRFRYIFYQRLTIEICSTAIRTFLLH